MRLLQVHGGSYMAWYAHVEPIIYKHQLLANQAWKKSVSYVGNLAFLNTFMQKKK